MNGGGLIKATWNEEVIAESNNCEVVEGNYYFPHDSIKKEFFKASSSKSFCPWKGEASYYDIEVNGKTNQGAAWYYPTPKPEAKNITNYVAFWKGVKTAKF